MGLKWLLHSTYTAIVFGHPTDEEVAQKGESSIYAQLISTYSMMDENQMLELQSTSWFNNYNQLLKKVLQFLVSLSLFSFLFLSCSSSPSSDFFHYLKFHSSALLFPILSQALDRKYIFLICNGIVAVLMKSLSFTTNSTPSPDFTEDAVKAVAEMEAVVDDKESTIGCAMEPLENVSNTEVEEEEENGSLSIRGGESPPLITEEEEEGGGGGGGGGEPLIPPPSAEDEGNEVNVSTEELNRKIDEFIRKMKEEIRIGPQKQQLVAV
ncbi:hypothetical protein RHGRI_037088 [Rhododendron griersonianum]|uniref:Uncharacterized protein n=1 Tax=Rhododendron griersonianum TaxID=479676 RepID=A0AAV6HR29_9ERIC|nr:hypothetical protein RHGRI_037088 [Rhododendron griersonianum]